MPEQTKKSDYEKPEKRPGPFAQDPSRTPPTKVDREDDYKKEKERTGDTFKKSGRTPA